MGLFPLNHSGNRALSLLRVCKIISVIPEVLKPGTDEPKNIISIHAAVSAINVVGFIIWPTLFKKILSRYLFCYFIPVGFVSATFYFVFW